MPSATAAVMCLCCLWAAQTALAARTPWGQAQTVPAVITTAAHAGEDPQPHWPRAFSCEFNETTKLFFLPSRSTSGTLYYDADQHAELVHRDNGRGDRYCGSIHPLTDTPCTHLVVGGNRYLIFPELGECCLCCTAAAGCGVLDPNWLQGAEFVGQVSMQGVTANEWEVRGLQPNQYYATADATPALAADVPLQLDQQPNDLITFHPHTYKPGPVPASVFDMPSGAGKMDCSQRCPLASVCTIAALQARVGRLRLGGGRAAAAGARPSRS